MKEEPVFSRFPSVFLPLGWASRRRPSLVTLFKGRTRAARRSGAKQGLVLVNGELYSQPVAPCASHETS